MQPRPNAGKTRHRIADYAVAGNHATNKQTFTPTGGSCRLYCICNSFSLAKCRKCHRCSESYHSCLFQKDNPSPDWECLHCCSIYMDPIYTPELVLLETFFRTENVFKYANAFEFVFSLTQEQLKSPVEIRCLQDGRTCLAWPMQGEFHINKQQYPEPVIDFKPLLKNSNRKNRREEAIILPAEKLRVGKNCLTFSIPKLNQAMFESKYQVQSQQVYFLGVYLIKKQSKEELIQKTFQKSKIDKKASLDLFKQTSCADPELAVEKQKLCLECPYMKSRIKIPIRGRKCFHYMVICLDTLIQTRTGVNYREWLCPICNSEINEPVIDMFILSMLNDGQAGLEVMVSVNGDYQWLAFEDDNLSISSDSSSRKPQQLPPQQPKTTTVEPKPANLQPKLLIPTQKPKEIVPVPKNKPGPPQKVIETIDLDDDAPDPLPVPSKNKVVGIAPPKSTPLQIMVPTERREPIGKQQIIDGQAKVLKQAIKSKKAEPQEVVFSRQNPIKPDFVLRDVPEVQFRAIRWQQYVKHYFNFEPQRGKVNQDLKIIFRQVL